MLSDNRKATGRKGMSLVELMIVVGVLGVIFAAVFFFFTRGIQQFHFSRRQNELATAGRLALEQITDEVIWAGYLPYGGIPADQWHPIQDASLNTFTFYADFEPFQQLDDTDYRNIFLGSDNTVHITDNASMMRRAGYNITSIEFHYLNQNGAVFSQPLTPAERDAVRHIRVTLTLQDTYMGHLYSTTMRTTISPRNLGLNRDIDPSFVRPPPITGIVVVNVDGTADEYTPTPDQYSMMQSLTYFGLTVVALADDELADYDYEDNNVNLVILRDVVDGPGSHVGISGPLNAIPCPVICLDADDAALVYHMGLTPQSTSNFFDTNLKIDAEHPIHEGVPLGHQDSLSFRMYNIIFENDIIMNHLSDLNPETDMITSIDGFGSTPGLVAVRDEALPTRRILYGLPSATEYSTDGFKFFYNVIFWAMGTSGSGDPGDPITAEEDFEGQSGQAAHMILWEDNLNNPDILPDSIPLFQDDFSGGKSLPWTFSSLGPSGRIYYHDETLAMDRDPLGAETRNIALTVLPLEGYDIVNDDLYLKVYSWRQDLEQIGPDDGVFFIDLSGSVELLLSEDFNNVGLGPGDVTFWGDLYGRSRIHAPSGWQGDGGFVTLDSRRQGYHGRVRMMLEVPTGGLGGDTPFTVEYRFHDHNDRNHPYNSGTGSGDFMGWNAHGVIEGPVNHITDFNPESYSSTQWHQRSSSFTIPGVPPNPLYLIFSQYDDGMAVDFLGNRGISFDNIHVYAGEQDTTYDRIGIPLNETGWRPIIIDLNAASIIHGVPFSNTYGVALSQSGTGPLPQRGIRWNDFEVGIVEEKLSMPGWTHGPIGGGIDDWSVRQNPLNPNDYMWALHAHNDGHYSNNSHCFVQTPSFYIPAQASDPTLSFRHSFNMESWWDYGYIQVSVGGGPWTYVGPDKGPTYNTSKNVNGEEIMVFSGNSGGWRTETVFLDTWVGQSVSFRFVFFSNASENTPYFGWYLDDFIAECMLEGYEVSSIGFMTTPSLETVFDHVDVYLGSTELSSFSGGGMWNTGELFHAYSGPLTFQPDQTWQTIPFDQSYFHPGQSNLIVKIETENTPITAGDYIHAERENVCRGAWGDFKPTFLPIQPTRPAMSLVINGTTVRVDDDGAQTSPHLPMSYTRAYTDFEAILTSEELGLGTGITWTSGGLNDDWEIGETIYIPDVDPPLVPENGQNIAGTALTLNEGYYSPQAWSWLASSGFPMADAAAYDTVTVRYFRCLRLASNDFAYVQMAFGNDPEVIPAEGQWETVRLYEGVYHNYWGYETVNLTSVFNDNASYSYYFIRFVLDSGVFGERGGWNLDNIQFFGRTQGGE